MKKWMILLLALVLTLSAAVAEPANTATLSFESNPSTGYAWTGFVLGGDSVELDSAEGTFVQDEQSDDALEGVGGRTEYVLTAVKPGTSIITFDYIRSQENVPIEQKAILAVVDEELNLSTMDVTEAGILEGTVISLDEDEHTALIENENLGEVLARFDGEMSLPVVDETIVIYTDGTMTMSLPAIVNVLAWSSVPSAEAR